MYLKFNMVRSLVLQKFPAAVPTLIAVPSAFAGRSSFPTGLYKVTVSDMLKPALSDRSQAGRVVFLDRIDLDPNERGQLSREVPMWEMTSEESGKHCPKVILEIGLVGSSLLV